MRMGKFSSDRDAALYWLCANEWGNDSTGNSTDWNCYAWRISNTWEEVKPEAMDFTSVIEDFLAEFLKAEDVEDSESFRRSLVGHFLVLELSNGMASVLEYETEAELLEAFRKIETEYSEWDTEDGEGN